MIYQKWIKWFGRVSDLMEEEGFVSHILFILHCVPSWKEKLDEFERKKKEVKHLYTHILF